MIYLVCIRLILIFVLVKMIIHLNHIAMDYLVIKDNNIIQVCTTIESLFEYLEVRVTDEGLIKIGKDGIEYSISFNMKLHTKESVIKDLEEYELKKIEGILQIEIYKMERIN